MRYVPRLPRRNHNISHESPLRELAILLFGLIGVLAGIYVLLGLAVNLVAQRLPVTLEYDLGEMMATSFPDSPDLASLRSYVQTVANRWKMVVSPCPFPSGSCYAFWDLYAGSHAWGTLSSGYTGLCAKVPTGGN